MLGGSVGPIPAQIPSTSIFSPTTEYSSSRLKVLLSCAELLSTRQDPQTQASAFSPASPHIMFCFVFHFPLQLLLGNLFRIITILMCALQMLS